MSQEGKQGKKLTSFNPSSENGNALLGWVENLIIVHGRCLNMQNANISVAEFSNDNHPFSKY